MIASAYVASKARHGGMWQAYREAWRELGLDVTSTWIDEWQPGATGSMADLWRRCVRDVVSADFLVLWVEAGETLKGALVEVGVALASGIPVYVCRQGDWTSADADRLGSWVNHPLVTMAASPGDAVEDYRAFWLKREWEAMS